MFDHVYRLSDTLASTKECIEDLFGAGTDLRRSNKNPWKCATVERLHHLASYWVRLRGDSWPKLKVCIGDFTQTRKMTWKRHINIGTQAPMSNALRVVRLSGMKKRQGRGCFSLLNVFVGPMWFGACGRCQLGDIRGGGERSCVIYFCCHEIGCVQNNQDSVRKLIQQWLNLRESTTNCRTLMPSNQQATLLNSSLFPP